MLKVMFRPETLTIMIRRDLWYFKDPFTIDVTQ